jgi:hypothetical protein
MGELSGSEHPVAGAGSSAAPRAATPEVNVLPPPPLRIAPDTYSRNWWIGRV